MEKEINLRKIDTNNVWKICHLKVKDNQKEFVATNAESIIEAFATREENDVAYPFGIYDHDTLIGFVMVGYNQNLDEGDPKISYHNYCIWRFMIDEKYQGQGYSRLAILKTIDFIKTFPCGKSDYIYLSYEPENKVAKKLYESIGFRENGEMDEGESISVLSIK